MEVKKVKKSKIILTAGALALCIASCSLGSAGVYFLMPRIDKSQDDQDKDEDGYIYFEADFTNFKGTSINSLLEYIGLPTDVGIRAKLAALYEVVKTEEEYKSTPKQNQDLFDKILEEGIFLVTDKDGNIKGAKHPQKPEIVFTEDLTNQDELSEDNTSKDALNSENKNDDDKKDSNTNKDNSNNNNNSNSNNNQQSNNNNSNNSNSSNASNSGNNNNNNDKNNNGNGNNSNNDKNNGNGNNSNNDKNNGNGNNNNNDKNNDNSSNNGNENNNDDKKDEKPKDDKPHEHNYQPTGSYQYNGNGTHSEVLQCRADGATQYSSSSSCSRDGGTDLGDKIVYKCSVCGGTLGEEVKHTHSVHHTERNGCTVFDVCSCGQQMGGSRTEHSSIGFDTGSGGGDTCYVSIEKCFGCNTVISSTPVPHNWSVSDSGDEFDVESCSICHQTRRVMKGFPTPEPSGGTNNESGQSGGTNSTDEQNAEQLRMYYQSVLEELVLTREDLFEGTKLVIRK